MLPDNYLKTLCAGAALAFTSASFAVELSPVTITGVEPATDGSDNLIITGTADDATSLDINGYPATLDGRAFTLLMPPAQGYQVNLYGADGSYQALNYAAPDAAVTSAVQVVVGEQLAQDVGPALSRLLENLDLNAVPGINPNQCVLDTWFLIGCDFYLREMAIQGQPVIDLYFTPGGGEQLTINIDIAIPSAVMTTDVKRSWWFGYDRTTMTTKDIDVQFQIGVEATSNQSIKLVLDDPSDVHLDIGSMTVKSTNIAAYMIPLFKDAIAGLVNTSVVAVAGPFLQLLPIPAIPLSLPLDIDGDGTDDAEFAINMAPEVLDVLPGGAGQAVISGAITSANVAPGRQVLGSRIIEGTLPGTEAVGGTTDLSADVSVNLLNQVLTAVYQSGIDRKLVVPLTVNDLGSFGGALTAFGYTLDTPLNIALDFGAAPEMQVNNDSLYPLGLDMVLPRMRMVMSVPGGDTDEVIMDLTADFLVSTSLGAESTGELHLEFGDLLALQNVQANGGRFVDLYGPGVLTTWVPLLLPMVITEYEPMINDLLAAPRLELDIGAMLTDWLNAEFPSVPVEGYVTEAGVTPDEAYMQVGLGIDFPQP